MTGHNASDIIYFDNLEGTDQACNGDPNYNAPCNMIAYFVAPTIIGIAFLNALFLCSTALNARAVRKVTSVDNNNNNNNNIATTSAQRNEHSSSYKLWLKSAGTFAAFGIAGHYFGMARLTPTDPRGKICDVLFGMYIVGAVVQLAVQRRDARYFDACVRGSNASASSAHATPRYKLGHWCHKLVEFIVGPAIVPLYILLWSLLMTEHLTRVECFNAGAWLQILAGLHTSLVMATKRLNVLAKVAVMQAKAKTDVSVAQRRTNALKGKLRLLLIDAYMVFTFSVLAPGFFLIFSVYSSSRRLVAWQCFFAPMGIVGNLIILLQDYDQRKKENQLALMRRHTGADGLNGGAGAQCSKLDSSLSVVHSSMAVIRHSPSNRIKPAPKHPEEL